MERKLAELGIATCADLRMHGADELERRFGRWGRRLHELAHGIDERAVSSERPTLQVSAEDTFERDLLLGELEPHIRRMAEKAWAGYLREREAHPQRIARTVVLKLKTSDFRTLTRSLTRRNRRLRCRRSPTSPAGCASASTCPRAPATGWPARAWLASATRTGWRAGFVRRIQPDPPARNH